MNLEPDLNTKQNNSLRSNIIEFLQSVIFAILVCIIVYLFIATPNQIEGESMYPTFENGEIVLTSKVHEWLGGTPFGKSIDLEYKRQDVVVFQKPGLDDFIKRIIAKPGDTIQLKDGKVLVNGTILEEDYLIENAETLGGSFLIENQEAKTLGQDEYFLMGDNRNNSRDSRYLEVGLVKREWLKGKVLIRYWPLSKLAIINN